MRLTSRDALPAATKQTINNMAFDTMRAGRANVKDDFINRNAFTRQSIRVDPSQTLNIQNQAAEVGSIAAYMADQESGGQKRSKGKHGVPLLTSVGSGEGRGVRPRKKLALRPNRLNRLKIMRRSRPGKTNPQRNIIAVKTAAKQGGGYVYMETGKRKGIYGVWGSEENPQVNLIYDLSHRTTKIPKNIWFDPAVQVGIDSRTKHWGRALRFQLRKHGLSTRNF
jgi:hypothetical protein